MKKYPLYNIVSLVLVLTLLVNTAVIPVMAEGNDNNRGIENPLNADYVLPAWEADTDETPEQIKPPVYRDGKILIYHYNQLKKIGTNEPVKDTDYLTNGLGSGNTIAGVTYSLSANYEIMQDIPLPRHTKWELPVGFTGTVTGTRSQNAQLYDSEKDIIYLYNPLQTAVMADEDSENEIVMNGDMDVSTFGTGNVIIPNGDSHKLTYSGKHNYVIAKGFSSAMATLSPSLIDSSSPFDGRDFQGQVIKEINGVEYILIGNQEQLRAIGSNATVYTAVYRANKMIYGGDADLLKSQNGTADYTFQNVSSGVGGEYGVYQKDETDVLGVHHMGEIKKIDESYKTAHKYSTKENYIIFRDIDLGGNPDITTTHWTPLMFSGSMTGAVAENGEKIWNANSTAITATRRAVISNIYVNQNQPIKVNEYIGIGFFATITNEINANDYGVSAGTVRVKNLELNQVEIHNTSTTATQAQTILSTITSGVGGLVGWLVAHLLDIVSLGSINISLENMLSDLLNARVNDPTIFSTGAFAGRIVGDVEIDNCSVTGRVIVTNSKNNTGGFVGYTNGVTQYSGLSQALGALTNVLESLLNVIPGLGLGDLITILLENSLPLGKLIPTGYLEPHINNCTVENLTGTVGQTDTDSSGGFVGLQIGTQMENCAVKNSDYIISAANYGGGFAGVERDAVVQGTLDGLGVDLLNVSQIVSDLASMDNFQTESLLRECRIENSTVTVSGGNYLGGFVGAMAASYAIDCDVKGTVSNPLKVDGTGSNIGGFAGAATIGWANSIGKNESGDNSLLSVVRQVATSLLSSDAGSNKKLLSLVGLVPSAIMGCQTDMSTVNVSGNGSFVGGILGNGEGILLTESSAAYMNQLTYWEELNLTEKTERENYLKNLESVISGGNYVGGAVGEVGAVSLAGVLDSAVSAGSFLSFTVSKVTVTGIDTGYTVISDGSYPNENIKGDFVSGGFGMSCGGTIHEVHLKKVKKIEAANNKAAGFVGVAGPGDLVGAGNNLTINLLGLNNVLNIKNLLSIGQAVHVIISDSDVTGIETGFTVEAKGSGNTNPGYQYLASGFIAQSNSTEISNCHTYSLKWVKAADVQGYSGGFIATSQTGGLTDVSDVDGVKSLLSIEGGLLGAISYLIPSYTNCTVNFVDGGYVSADIAGGFVADMQSGTVDNSTIAAADDSNNPQWTKTMQELYDPDAVNATGDLEKQFAVFNIDSVRGQTYGGGFAGKVRSGALAGSSGGISVLGNTGLSINISELLGVINAYVPFVSHAGVYSENGFVVAADEIRSGDPHSGSAGGFAGYASGAQISHCDVYRLRHTEVTPPDDLESIAGASYFDNTQSQYAVVGGHYAGGYVGNMDIGDAASVGKGLKILGESIQLTNILSALSVVVTTIEHSDVQGAGGGFSVIADKTGSHGKVGMSGGYAGAIFGGHIQNSHCKNFYYVIGQETAGGYVGNMEPGNVANLMEDTSLLSGLVDIDSGLASLAEDFVPTIRNSTTSCVPCGGAVRAQAVSDSGHQRGCAGGFCGHNEGGHIWGLNTDTWKDQNDGIVLGHDFGHNTEGNYIGEQHICTAWRIRSVYGYEYAGGFTGFMETADTAETGNISLLGGLIKIDNLLGALSAVYPTEKNTAVYGPLRNIDIATWNSWVNYIGKFGGYGAELAKEGTASNQTELNEKLLKYIYGFNVAAGRTSHEQMLITEGGNAGGYVGYMVSGVISNGQTHDIRHIRAMRSAGGYAGRMKTGGAANFGSASILGLNLNLGQLVKAAEVFVPTIRSGSVYGWQSGMTVTATGTDFIHNCGYAGGYVGSGYGAQIWGDKGVDDGQPSGCNVVNLKYVRGTNAVGGFAGMVTAASVADANTNASDGLLQSILNSLISTPGDLASVLQATVTTIRQVEITIENQTNDSSNKDFGFIVEGYNGTIPQFAGGFAGSLEASVIGSRKGESHIIVNDLRGVYGQYYAGGFVGLADVGSVASVSSDEGTGGGTSILGLIQAGNVDVLDIFRTYIYYSEVNGVDEGIIVRASTSAGQGILSETRYSGCAGGFGGGVMNGSVKNSKATNLNTVSGLNYNGGFIGHMGKNGAVDIDKAQIAGPLLAGLNAGILDIFGTVVDNCEVQGIEAGAVISSVSGQQHISGGFTGYGDVSQIKNSRVISLKQVYSDEIAGGFIGKTNMEYLVNAEIDSELVQAVLQILNILLKILLIPNLENLDLLDTNKLLNLIGVQEIPLGLKLLSDGDLLYVNLLGLKIGVSLVKDEGNNTTGTAIVTIGDSSVELPYDENGFNVDNPEVVVNLLKGNATRVMNCSVTGIDIGYDVYGGGASNDADGTNANGYAGGFVGYNNEGRLFDNKMIYCDVVRGTAGKIGHFSGVSVSGYKPDKLMNGDTPVTYSDTAGTAGQGNVYRISVPNEAVYFRITNGTKDGDIDEYLRQSEMKLVTANGLYRFIPNAEKVVDYIEENNIIGDIGRKHFLLELVNEIRNDDEEPPESKTYDVRLATVVTGADGRQEKIIWLKLNDEGNDVDKHYLDHQLTDIWNEDTNPDAKVTEVRLMADAGKCYWKETAAPAGYKLQTEKTEVTSVTTEVINERLPGQIILKKTAKEKVGINDIGAVLADAKFRLVTVNQDNTLGDCVPLARLKNKFEYEYYNPNQSNTVNAMTASGEYETNNGSLVRYNVMTTDAQPVYDISTAPVTGYGGTLKINNLPCGDYCLEEVQSPEGYSHMDSNTNSNRKIYFSVGNNTIIKNIICSDEMDAAYIRLFEHINEYRPNEWGNPTFIFKIKQTGYYEWQEPEGEEPVWALTANPNGREFSVALTVDENGKWTEGLTSHSNPDYDYNNWYEEATKEPEYKGMYHIGEDGKIRIEPGTYEITRIPVSRYEFVENTWKLDTDDDTVYHSNRTETEKMTVTIPAGKTATVHYYDRVEYYDKFSHEDTAVNKFYTLDGTTKENKTVKGIRIEDYHQKSGDTDENGVMTVKAADLGIYKIMSDGSEVKMTDDEKAALTGTNFIVSYAYDSESNDAESFGNQENINDNDFSYDNSAEVEGEPEKYPSIVIKNAQRYANGVYTLTAVYQKQTAETTAVHFTAIFDIVFSRSS